MRASPVHRALPALAGLLVAGWAGSVQGQQGKRGGPSTAGLIQQVDQVHGQVKNAEENLRLVETQYTLRPEPSPEDAQLRRFSDGEIQYLLGDWRSASVLFYDLVSDPAFKGRPRYADALHYLSDSLHQQGNYIGARLYLRELLGLRTAHYRDALTRYLEIAGRLNEFVGIDEFIEQARGLSGGELSPELAYVYGKWLFKRSDLPQEERLRRARAVFEDLAQRRGPAQLSSAYFLGVAFVQERRYEQAVEQFRRVAKAPHASPAEEKVKELAHLSSGRVLYEMELYPEAIDRYQEVPRQSAHFPDALYEISWSRVKQGEFQLAKNATDILLLVAPESTLAPKAQILQGHLLLKLQRYEEATETYSQVIDTYSPVRDEIDALLTVNQDDPVAYFDDLLARNERNLDVTQLLPPVALKWATTQREVADAARIVDDLETGRRGVTEGRDLARRILAGLDERGLETFPELQEGYTRADAVESALTRAEESLVRIEGEILGPMLKAEDLAGLEAVRSARQALAKRFAALPGTQSELEARRRRLKERVDGADRQAFRLGYEVQSAAAVTQAIEKWVHDTRTVRRNTPEEEREFLEQLGQETRQLAMLERELEQVRLGLKDQRALADASVGGEGEIRRQYEASLGQERVILARAEGTVPAEGRRVLERAAQVRRELRPLRERVGRAKDTLREQVGRRGLVIREKVLAEQRLLETYQQEVASASGEARNLVGRIAFDSFRRVREEFYELVLKADVGAVDVAFTRKQDKTLEIQRLSLQKDRELKALDEEFREVLRDVD